MHQAFITSTASVKDKTEKTLPTLKINKKDGEEINVKREGENMMSTTFRLG
jgi:hypothetical protein